MLRGQSLEITDKITEHSANILAQWIGGFTVIKNQKTMEQQAAYQAWKDSGEQEDRPGFDKATAHIHKKKGFEFLKTLPAEIRRNAGSCWHEDMVKFLRGVNKPPKVRGKHKRRSCYVTKELFRIDPLDNDSCVIRFRALNSKSLKNKFFLHVRLPFPAKDAANALYISRQGARFWLSMAHENHVQPLDEPALRDYLHGLTREELELEVDGYDVGVVRQVTDSNGIVYHMDDTVKRNLEKLEKIRIRHQKRYSRVQRANDRRHEASKNAGKKRKQTNGERKASKKIAAVASKRTNIRKNTSHLISKAIAESAPSLAVFEDISLPNLTRRSKPKQCPETGKWLPNNARAKSGLNKSILNLNLGQIRDFTEYKLNERNKLMIKVPAAYSSQECSQCGHTSKDNRPSQATFLCTECGYAANADDNAAKVIKKRGIESVLSPTFTQVKAKKRVTARRRIKARETASLGIGGLDKTGDSSARPSDELNQGFSLAAESKEVMGGRDVSEASPEVAPAT